VKSDQRKESEAPNIISANRRFKSRKESGLKFISSASSRTQPSFRLLFRAAGS
jgi:hypothetical protein